MENRTDTYETRNEGVAGRFVCQGKTTRPRKSKLFSRVMKARDRVDIMVTLSNKGSWGNITWLQTGEDLNTWKEEIRRNRDNIRKGIKDTIREWTSIEELQKEINKNEGGIKERVIKLDEWIRLQEKKQLLEKREEILKETLKNMEECEIIEIFNGLFRTKTKSYGTLKENKII